MIQKKALQLLFYQLKNTGVLVVLPLKTSILFSKILENDISYQKLILIALIAIKINLKSIFK